MANLLYLVHRLPYPPNKGDKVRSYHLLKHLAVIALDQYLPHTDNHPTEVRNEVAT